MPFRFNNKKERSDFALALLDSVERQLDEAHDARVTLRSTLRGRVLKQAFDDASEALNVDASVYSANR